MEIARAIRKKPNKKIKKLVAEKGIPFDETWADYKALNCSILYGNREIAYLLVEANCRVNRNLVDKSVNTPLHNAVRQNDQKLVNELLKRNAAVTAVNSTGNSPLHLAFVNGYEKITDSILQFIQNTSNFVNLKNNNGLTHLHIACARNNPSIVCSYLETTPSNLNDSVNKDSPYYPGYTVLDFALQLDSPQVLKLLLEHKGSFSTNQIDRALKHAKKNLENQCAMVHLLSNCSEVDEHIEVSQLHIACMQKNPSLVNNLLKLAASVNKPISEEATFCPLYTPLHFAVEANCKQSVQLLLQHCADPDSRNANWMTPLHLGMYNDNQDIIELLYESTKVKIWQADLADCFGLDYFHIAISRNDLQLVKRFLRKGQDVNASVCNNCRNFSGCTSLHFAVLYGHIRMVKLLIENGADINVSDLCKHGTPLHIAFSRGRFDIIELLLKHNARVDYLHPCDSKTILHLLIEMKRDIGIGNRHNQLITDYIYLLVFTYRVDVNAQDSNSHTALHYACTNMAIGASCAKVLLMCGADINIENAMGETPFEVIFHSKYCKNHLKDYMLLYDHVQHLHVLALSVNPKNYKCCAKLYRDRNKIQKGAACLKDYHLKQKQQERKSESEGMKGGLLWYDLSMYNFVRMSSLELRAVGEHHRQVLWDLIENGYLNYIPNLAYFVELQWRRLCSQQP